MKVDVHMLFLFDSLSIVCFHENGAWICHVYGLMVLLVYSLIISGNVCSWASFNVECSLVRFMIYVMFWWKLMLDSYLPCHAEHFCVTNLEFWEISWKHDLKGMNLLTVFINPRNFPALPRKLVLHTLHGAGGPGANHFISFPWPKTARFD